MVDAVDWPVEDIPDDNHVLMRAHRVFFREDVLLPSVFRPHGDSMSVDWTRYSTPQDTRNRAPIPDQNAVIRLPVIGIRKTPPLDVRHTPEPENRAHSEVLGLPTEREDLTEIRILLLGFSETVLALPPVDDRLQPAPKQI